VGSDRKENTPFSIDQDTTVSGDRVTVNIYSGKKKQQ
jgi:hypothetical protein